MAEGNADSPGKNRQHWVFNTIIMVNVLAAIFLGGAFFKFGSTRNAFCFIAGDRLLSDHKTKDFGSCESGQLASVVFRLTNYSHHVITVLGAKVSCSCTVAQNLPMEIKPSGTRSLEVSIDTKKRNGHISEKLELYTTDGLYPGSLRLEVSGRVVSKPAPR